jgi:hypothetical protein
LIAQGFVLEAVAARKRQNTRTAHVGDSERLLAGQRNGMHSSRATVVSALGSGHELARRAVKHLAIAVAPGVATQAVGPSALSGTVSDWPKYSGQK